MGCECKQESGDGKSEILNYNSKSEIENKFANYYDSIDPLKSSISNSLKLYTLEKQEVASLNTEIKEEKIIPEYNQNYLNYSQKMFEIINKIRENPSSYADVIENSIINIIEKKDKNNNEINKIIYKKGVKVALNLGEKSFREAAKELRAMTPITQLKFKKEICIPLPEREEDIKNSNYVKNQVSIIREKNNIDVFYKDLIKDPEVSSVLMIVDDNLKNPGKKRQAVLDENFKYIGISSGFVGKSFIAYFSFSR